MFLQYCLVVTRLVPHETAAILAHVLWTPYNHAPVVTWLVPHETANILAHVLWTPYCHAPVVTWLVPHETAAILVHLLWTSYNQAPVYSHFIQSHICKVPVCLAVTCHLHFWQNDLAVAWEWNGYQTESWLWRRMFSCHSCGDSNPQPFDHESGTLPLSYPHSQDASYW